MVDLDWWICHDIILDQSDWEENFPFQAITLQHGNIRYWFLTLCLIISTKFCLVCYFKIHRFLKVHMRIWCWNPENMKHECVWICLTVGASQVRRNLVCFYDSSVFILNRKLHCLTRTPVTCKWKPSQKSWLLNVRGKRNWQFIRLQNQTAKNHQRIWSYRRKPQVEWTQGNTELKMSAHSLVQSETWRWWSCHV